jgi:predicted ATP-grasp superfamily ATP-dependent carboligase
LPERPTPSMKPIFKPKPSASDGVSRSRRVLAIVGDTQVGLWVVRSLGRHGLTVFSVCASDRGLAAHSRYSSGAWVIESSPTSPGFLDEVEALARELDVGSIITIAEGYHVALIRGRDRFEPHIRILSPPGEAFDKATDKHFMHGLCERLGVPVAKGTTLDKLMDAGGNGLRFPLVMRDSRQNDRGAKAHAPWKAAYADDRAQLEDLYRSVRDIAANVIVQEYHAGAEDHVQILMHRSEAFAVGEYIGEHHMPLAGGVTVQRVSCRHEPVIRDAVRLLEALDWDGIAGVQFHYDPATDKYIFLEINPRFIGGLPTLIMAGFHAPFLLWQSHFEPGKMRRPKYRLGLRTRILGGDANWMLANLRADPLPPGQTHFGKLSAVTRFLWNCGPWTKEDTFNLHDVRPFFVDFGQMLKRLRSNRLDIIGNPETQGAKS